MVVHHYCREYPHRTANLSNWPMLTKPSGGHRNSPADLWVEAVQQPPCTLYGLTEWGTHNNRSCRHSSHCFNNLLSELRCLNFMHKWPRWMRWDVVHVLRDSLVLSFTHILLSVCDVARTSIHRSYTPLPTAWILALYHLNFRFAHVLQ